MTMQHNTPQKELALHRASWAPQDPLLQAQPLRLGEALAQHLSVVHCAVQYIIYRVGGADFAKT